HETIGCIEPCADRRRERRRPDSTHLPGDGRQVLQHRVPRRPGRRTMESIDERRPASRRLSGGGAGHTSSGRDWTILSIGHAAITLKQQAPILNAELMAWSVSW